MNSTAMLRAKRRRNEWRLAARVADARIADEPNVFQSFWMGGFEGADHVNRHGVAVDPNDSNDHRACAGDDYARLAPFGMRTVRESAGWRLCEGAGGIDFAPVATRARAAAELGIQVAWTLCHYGLPPGLHPAHRLLAARFARFCEAAARYLRHYQVGTPVFTPVNEISFFTWAATCDPPFFHGFPSADAHAIKRNLVAASLAGIDAIRQVLPDARILLTDPLIRVVAAAGRPDLAEAAATIHRAQFESFDLHAAAGALDLVGVNYYHSNQWETPGERTLMWHLDDPARAPLHALLGEIWERYHRPLVIAETSHVGEGRGAWIRHVAGEVRRSRDGGIDIRGLCIYPVIDRTDWEASERWHWSGLWDVGARKTPPARGLDMLYARDLREAQSLLDRASTPDPKGMPMTALVVFSHLRWNFVYQRPQHLLARLAAHYPVIFVEEPVAGETSRMEQTCVAPNVRVLVPQLREGAGSFDARNSRAVGALLAEFLEKESLVDWVAWLYTPMALDALGGLKPRGVVYDCMDELTGFRGASPALAAREAELLARADLVFTGGPSLYAARRERHHDIHCFPSSVDREHFAAAADADAETGATRDLPRPRLGFFGVIDERLDIELVSRLADAHPDWQIVLVGPVVKIDPSTLPERPNVTYFGQQPYARLPAFIAGWDVCLLPFALNEATRFISPTKTLEYMAAGKPVVSTAVRDVIDLYGRAVRVAAGHEEFIAHCETALAESDAERSRRQRAADEILERTSWDDTAARMHRLLQRALTVRSGVESRQRMRSRAAPPASAKPSRVVIAGAGPTGLSAGYHFGEGATIVEQGERVGGLCRSIVDRGFTFDQAGHIMFSNDPYVHQLYRLLLGDNVHWQDREAWIYSHGVHTRYPFQGALHGLPPQVLKECILGAIEARFGSLDGTTGDAREPVRDCCADGTDPTAGASTITRPARSRNFREFILETWGRGIAKHFAIPYNQKLWATPLEEIETSWLEGRVPLPDLEEIIDGAVQPVAKPQGPNARFGYPLRGGFQALMDGFLPHLECDLRLGARIARVSPARKTVTLADGTTLSWQVLINTMPLPALVHAIGAEAPREVRRAAGSLRGVSVRCVNIGVGRPDLTEKHWIYYPGDTVFHRIFVQGNASPLCNPPGGFGLTCEITYSPEKPLPCDGEELARLCIADCVRVGMMAPDDPVLTWNMVDIPLAYVVYEHQRSRNVALIRNWLREHDILLAGRYSEWEYYNSDHAFLAGRRAAQQARARLAELQQRAPARPRPAVEEARPAAS